MSYDFSGQIGEGEDATYVEPLFDDVHPALGGDGIASTVIVTATGYTRCGNYTSNVSGIWRRCLSVVIGTGEEISLADLADRRCGDIAMHLAAAVLWGVGHIDELRKMNPPNGWGNAEGAVTYLWDIQRFCEANPTAILRISR